MFLFPSTGKAFPNQLAEELDRADHYCFYSLPPGRRFQTMAGLGIAAGAACFWFLFPSTGTAFPNIPTQTLASILTCCFYSLPPGRRFQTEHGKPVRKLEPERFLFPSTGTAFPNSPSGLGTEQTPIRFLFPSTGKTFPNSTTSKT